MSRAYRIRVSESLRRYIHVEDCVTTTLELLQVLPAQQMSELLTAALQAQGFEVTEDGKAVRTEEDGVRLSVDLATGEVTISISEESEVDLERDGEARATRPDDKDVKAKLARKVQGKLEADAAAEQEKRQAALTARLEQRIRDLQPELDQVANKVTGEALKVRAAQMGEIEEITEDPESGSMTIKVKL